jgi:hypothetical protein
MKTVRRLIIPFLLFLVYSCGPSGDKVEVKSIQVALTSSGPLYEGSNTATVDWDVDFSKYMEQVPKSINQVRFLNVRLKCNNDSVQANIGNPVVQLAAGDLAMAKVAYAEENLQANQAASLKIAAEQKNIDEFFKGKKITFVLDYDLKQEEFNEDLTFSMEFDLEMYVNN